VTSGITVYADGVPRWTWNTDNVFSVGWDLNPLAMQIGAGADGVRDSLAEARDHFIQPLMSQYRFTVYPASGFGGHAAEDDYTLYHDEGFRTWVQTGQVPIPQQALDDYQKNLIAQVAAAPPPGMPLNNAGGIDQTDANVISWLESARREHATDRESHCADPGLRHFQRNGQSPEHTQHRRADVIAGARRHDGGRQRGRGLLATRGRRRFRRRGLVVRKVAASYVAIAAAAAYLSDEGEQMTGDDLAKSDHHRDGRSRDALHDRAPGAKPVAHAADRRHRPRHQRVQPVQPVRLDVDAKPAAHRVPARRRRTWC
jgi:hypothetical protein